MFRFSTFLPFTCRKLRHLSPPPPPHFFCLGHFFLLPPPLRSLFLMADLFRRIQREQREACEKGGLPGGDASPFTRTTRARVSRPCTNEIERNALNAKHSLSLPPFIGPVANPFLAPGFFGASTKTSPSPARSREARPMKLKINFVLETAAWNMNGRVSLRGHD